MKAGALRHRVSIEQKVDDLVERQKEIGERLGLAQPRLREVVRMGSL